MMTPEKLQIVQITLLRFHHTAQKKVCTLVDIPRSLFLSSCGASICEHNPSSPLSNGGQKKEHAVDVADAGVSVDAHTAGAPEDGSTVEYELCGVVTHAGSTIQSGHYYSFVRHLNGTHWLLCDDSTVSNSSFQRAVTPTSPTETPYLLFYMRSSALQHAAASAAAARAAIPPMLRAEVDRDNRLARSLVSTGVTAPLFQGRPDEGGGQGGGGSGSGGSDAGGSSGEAGAAFGPSGAAFGPSWGVA
jgi:hypothetical protein